MNFKQLAFSTLIGTVFLSNPASCAETEAEQLKQAQTFYKQKQYQSAGDLLQKTLVADPNNAQAHYLMGNVLMMLNDTDDARREYEMAKTLAPNGQIADYCNRALAALPQKPQTQKGSATIGLGHTNPNGPNGFVVVPVGSRQLLVNNKLLEREEVRRLIQECDSKMGQKERDLQVRLDRIAEDMTRDTDNTSAYKEARASYSRQMQQAKNDAEKQETLLQEFYSKKINSFSAAADMKRAYHQ